jgi:WD40 repeat protein
MSTRKKSKKKAKKKSQKKAAPRKVTRKAKAKTKTTKKPKTKKKAKTRAKPKAGPRKLKLLAAAFSGDGRVLATAAGKRVLIWDVSSSSGKPKAMGVVKTQVDASRLALDFDGKRLAAAVAGFSEVRIRSVSNGALLHEVRARGAVTCFAFAPDGRFVLGEVERIGEDGLRARSFVTVIDLASGAELFRTAILDLPIREIAFSSDGLLLSLGFGGGVVVIFDMEARRELFRFPALDPARDRGEIGARIAASFSFSRDGRRAAVQWGNVVEVWPIDGGDRIATIDLGDRAWSVALSHDGTRVVAGAPAAGVWSVKDAKKVKALDVGHDVVASPDAKRVIAGDRIDAKAGPALVATDG